MLEVGPLLNCYFTRLLAHIRNYTPKSEYAASYVGPLHSNG